MGQSKEFKQFRIVDDDVFIWKGERLGFDAIRHLFFSWVKTTVRVNSLKAGEPEEAQLLITLVDGRIIHFHFDEQTILTGVYTDKKINIEKLKQLHVCLLRRSFEHRLAHYLRELEQKGYFEYDECRFYPKERTIFFRKKPFPLATHDFVK